MRYTHEHTYHGEPEGAGRGVANQRLIAFGSHAPCHAPSVPTSPYLLSVHCLLKKFTKNDRHTLAKFLTHTHTLAQRALYSPLCVPGWHPFPPTPFSTTLPPLLPLCHCHWHCINECDFSGFCGATYQLPTSSRLSTPASWLATTDSWLPLSVCLPRSLSFPL